MQAYPRYKDSGIPWLGCIPEHWDIKPGFSVFREKQVKNKDAVENRVLSLSYGKIIIKPEEKLRGLVPESFETYQIVDRGDIIIRSTDMQNDHTSLRTGIVNNKGIITSAYICLHSIDMKFCNYNHWLLHGLDLMKVFYGLGSGLRQNLSWIDFKRLPLPIPSQDEQIQISRYLDWQTSKINKFIKTKKKLLELLCERRCVITDNAIRLPETQHIRLGIVTRQMVRSIGRRNDEVYTPIGLYNRGRGIFHKQPTKGSELGGSTFYEVKENDLVFSGQFAWEGAVAIASINDDGCIASHRYPIFRGKEGIVDSAYLLAFFRTDLGDIILNHHSRGAAGRNRPLNPRTLIKEKIPIPPLLVQKDIADIVRQEIALRQEIAKEEKLIREYRDRLISDVVTGKVDVRSVKIPDFDSVEMEQEVEGDEEAEDELITESIEE